MTQEANFQYMLACVFIAENTVHTPDIVFHIPNILPNYLFSHYFVSNFQHNSFVLVMYINHFKIYRF